MNVPLVDLTIGPSEHAAITAAFDRVLASGHFLLGPELRAFESALGARCSGAEAVGVGSGTDALSLGMRACGIGPGDEVMVPALTAFPTAAAVMAIGAEPVLVDVLPDRPLIDPASVARMIGPRTRAVIAVHLYGVTADVAGLGEVVSGTAIDIIEDCAQAQGATLPSGEPVGTVGAFGAYSFYPTKVLGSLGDGGAVVTGTPELAAEVRAWRSHGERSERYLHELPAGNSRLSELQAAVLQIRLAGLDRHLSELRRLSTRYAEALPPSLGYVAHGDSGAPHLAVIRVEDPATTAVKLRSVGIDTGRHYPRPLTQQPALEGARRDATPNAAAWARSVVSIPLYDGLGDAEQVHVIRSLHTVL